MSEILDGIFSARFGRYPLGSRLRWVAEPGDRGRAWLGGMDCLASLGGVDAHIFALRVGDNADGEQIAMEPAFYDEVLALQEINGGRLKQSRLPGLEGEWVVCAHSLGDC